MSSNPWVPHDILIEILEKLPVKSLLRFKCVCKSWRDTIESRQFVRKQLEYSRRSSTGENVLIQVHPSVYRPSSYYRFYSAEAASSQSQGVARTINLPKPIPIKGNNPYPCERDIEVCSCDGLLLLVEKYIGMLTLMWNPTTQKFKNIRSHPCRDSVHSVHGFGYDSSKRDYKIVRMDHLGDGLHRASILALRTNSWTKKRAQRFTQSYRVFPYQKTAFIHGSVHFLASDRGIKARAAILPFSLVEETFRGELPIPPLKQPQSPYYFRLKVLGGRLCLQGVCRNYEFVVWLMTEYGHGDSLGLGFWR